MSSLLDIESFILSEKDKDVILELIEIAYSPREPLCLGLHYSHNDVLPIHNYEVEKGIESGCSIGMRDKYNGKLVGVMLNIIITSSDEILFNGPDFGSEKCNIYYKILYDFCYGVNVLNEDGMKKQMDLLLLTVHPDYCGRGLAKQLIRLSEEKGREFGCDVSTIQATNHISSEIAKKLGYKTVRKMDLATVKDNLGRPLLDLPAMRDTTHFYYLKKHL